ncbi:MAG: hypothetical protein ACR2LF_09340 [Jatrophihabitantaceae bacterium]
MRTNAIGHLERLEPEDLPLSPAITAVALAKLPVGRLVTDEAADRATRQAIPRPDAP